MHRAGEGMDIWARSGQGHRTLTSASQRGHRVDAINEGAFRLPKGGTPWVRSQDPGAIEGGLGEGRMPVSAQRGWRTRGDSGWSGKEEPRWGEGGGHARDARVLEDSEV